MLVSVPFMAADGGVKAVAIKPRLRREDGGGGCSKPYVHVDYVTVGKLLIWAEHGLAIVGMNVGTLLRSNLL